MANLSQVQRVVYRHDWVDLGEWVAALAELSELSDDEIDGIAGEPHSPTTGPVTA